MATRYARTKLALGLTLLLGIASLQVSHQVEQQALAGRQRLLVPLELQWPDPHTQMDRLLKTEAILANAIASVFPYARNVELVAQWIVSASMTYEIDPWLLAGLIAKESSYNLFARSHVNAIRLAQIRVKYWGEFCSGDLSQPANNVWCSAKIVDHLRDKTGSLEMALAYYNVGEGNYRVSRYYKAAANRYISSVERNTATLQATAFNLTFDVFDS